LSLSLPVSHVHPERGDFDHVEFEFQNELLGPRWKADIVVASLIANVDFDLGGVRVEWACFAREFPNRVDGDDDVYRAASKRKLHAHALELQRLGGWKDRIFDHVPGWASDLDRGRDHPLRYGLAVDMDPFTQLAAHDQLSKDTLAEGPFAAMDER
jgi:hypothetical protein